MADELILIVEDNEKNLKLARFVLAAGGFRTIEAQTAEAGLSLAREHLPDLILMDIQLPGMDGVTALQHLKAAPQTAAVPVVALTAFAMKDDQERFLGAGFNGYLAKPIDVKRLSEQVRGFLDQLHTGG